MKTIASRLLLAATALILASGCDDMHDQPSVKAQEAPRLSAPAESVPVRGRVVVKQGEALRNPVPAGKASFERGADLYRINCALCHGTRDTFPGKVGARMQPPPPDLRGARVRELSDSDLFQRITFGFGRMPPFERRIDYFDRWHIVNFMRLSNDQSNGKRPVIKKASGSLPPGGSAS